MDVYGPGLGGDGAPFGRAPLYRALPVDLLHDPEVALGELAAVGRDGQRAAWCAALEDVVDVEVVGAVLHPVAGVPEVAVEVVRAHGYRVVVRVVDGHLACDGDAGWGEDRIDVSAVCALAEGGDGPAAPGDLEAPGLGRGALWEVYGVVLDSEVAMHGAGWD